MRPIIFDTKSSFFSLERQQFFEKKAMPEVDRVADAWGSGYQSPYAFLSLSADRQMHAKVVALAQEKKLLNPEVLVVIGIGGSSLGAMAVHEALNGLLYNQTAGMKLFFAESVDSDYISTVYALSEQVLKKGKKILVVVISKSGATTETIANAQLFIALLRHYESDYASYVVTITDYDSALDRVSKEHGIATLAIPKNVGGRYSVLSAVGLFPLAMLGVDIAQLIAGAESTRAMCTAPDMADNPALMGAGFVVDHYQHGMNIHDTFVFVQSLRAFGNWYRQLMGESIGKERIHAGTKTLVGITPTVSVGSIDLHSVAQLYLAGPYDKTTTFITVARDQKEVQLPADAVGFDNLVENIAGKSFHTVMHAIIEGVQTAYTTGKRPFISVELPMISPYYMGQLLQIKMVEMVYVGYLLQVNPFDQPHVELYKRETRKILNHE